jgi:hypothetical protein
LGEVLDELARKSVQSLGTWLAFVSHDVGERGDEVHTGVIEISGTPLLVSDESAAGSIAFLFAMLNSARRSWFAPRGGWGD